MRIAYRVDASSRMGTGHVVRCLALARALRAKDAECSFIHRFHRGNMVDAIRREGFVVHELPAPTATSEEVPDGEYERWLGVPVDEDGRQTAAVLEDMPVDWLVVDHYALAAEWERVVRPHAERVAVIDDLADREHDCDLLVDQNFFPDAQRRYEDLVPQNCKLLTGPRYALMRPEYAEVRRLIGPRRGPVSRVLVFYGGSDRGDQTSRALRVLSRPEFEHLGVDVVVGSNHPDRTGVENLAARRPLTDVHGSLEHLAGLMAEADVALGGGGSTTWERCATGLPSIVIAVAENQVPFTEALGEDDRILYLGEADSTTEEHLAEALQTLVDDPERLRELAERSWYLTDGLGALRVAEAIAPTERERLSVRPARQEDKALYFDWANDPDTRRHAFNSEFISWDDHSQWFDQRLRNGNSWLFVLQTPRGLPVGQVRIDRRGNDGVLDFSVDPAFRGRGWGTLLLQRAVEASRDLKLDVALTGTVLPKNIPSQRAFLRAGFIEVGRDERGAIQYHLPPFPLAEAQSPTGR